MCNFDYAKDNGSRYHREPTRGIRIFTCPAGIRFIPIAQHDIPCTKGSFTTNGHHYNFDG